MWGTDTKGCLLKPKRQADDKLLDTPTAVHLPDHTEQQQPLSNIAKVVCGPTDTAILFEDGSCLVCGENKSGQLGLGHKNPVPTLQPVRLPGGGRVAQVALGTSTGAFVDDTGDLYTSGFGGSAYSGFGVLGQGEGQSCETPLRVDSLVEDGCVVKQCQLGELHMTVLTTEGEVLTCGTGSYGRLGNFETVDQLYLEPVEILGSGNNAGTQIAGGKSFTLALTKEGVLYGWGRNHKGQLGTGLGLAVDMYAMQSVPEPIDSEADELLGRKVTHVAAGHSHAVCITDNGNFFFWGMSLHLEPVPVDSLSKIKVADVACGQDYTLAISKDGKLFSFGVGKTGVLGQGNIRRSNQPAGIKALDGKKIVQVSAGWKHAACLVEDE